MNTLKSPSKTAASFLKRWLAGWLPLWVWTALVFRGAVLPPSQIPSFLQGVDDKLLHGIEFFILFLAAANAFRLAKSVVFRHSGVMAFGYGILLGVVTEAAQRAVPGRSPEVLDLLADTAGTAFGLCLYALIRLRNYKRISKRT